MQPAPQDDYAFMADPVLRDPRPTGRLDTTGTFAAFGVGPSVGALVTYLRRTANRANQYEAGLLNDWRNARCARRAPAPSARSLDHLDAMLSDFDTMAPLIAELRSYRASLVQGRAAA